MDELVETYEYSDLEYIAANAIGMDDIVHIATKRVPDGSQEPDISEAEGFQQGAQELTDEMDESSESASDSTEDDEDIVSIDESELEGDGNVDGLQSAVEWLCDDEAETAGDGSNARPPRTKNEVEEPAELPEEKCVDVQAEELALAGVVATRVDAERTLLIQSDPTASPLNEGSTLCLADGKVFGKVHEVFGPVTAPFYIVRWAELSSSLSSSAVNPALGGTDDAIQEEGRMKDITAIISGIAPGTRVFSIRRLAQFIAPATLLRGKGSDASNLWDEEVPAEEQEFSDDEAELEARQARNQLKKGKRAATAGIGATGDAHSSSGSGARSLPARTTSASAQHHQYRSPVGSAYTQPVAMPMPSYPHYNANSYPAPPYAPHQQYQQQYQQQQQQQYHQQYQQQYQRQQQQIQQQQIQRQQIQQQQIQQQGFAGYPVTGWTPPPPPTPPPQAPYGTPLQGAVGVPSHQGGYTQPPPPTGPMPGSFGINTPSYAYPAPPGQPVQVQQLPWAGFVGGLPAYQVKPIVYDQGNSDKHTKK